MMSSGVDKFTPGSIRYYCGWCDEYISAEWSSDVLNHVVTQHIDRTAPKPTVYILRDLDDACGVVLDLNDCTADWVTPA